MSATGHYDQVISLGRACQPAYQLRRILGAETAHVFDWLITPDQALLTLIESDFDQFFARERLTMGPEEWIIDRETDTRFIHEFPKGSDFEAQYEANAGRFAMLVERWRELLASEQRVLFVRQHGWDADPRATATRLREAIAQQAPSLRFALLYLTETEEPDWGEAGILNRRLNQLDPYEWQGDGVAWSTLLGEAVSVPPAARDCTT
jgi:hypothetical protein